MMWDELERCIGESSASLVELLLQYDDELVAANDDDFE